MRAADAIVVGAGPNGLVAALILARAGLAVDVYEAAEEAGGGCRTAELTLPGFRHDICSTVHPLLLASPAFRAIDLARHGVRLLTPEVAFAHPLDDGRAAAVGGSVGDVAATLGTDGPVYARTYTPLVRDLDKILPAFLGSMRSVPASPLAAGKFGLAALTSAHRMAERFATDEGRALVAGTAAHAMLPLTAPLSGAFPRLFTALAHRYGWPVVEGGSAAIAGALVDELTRSGGRVETDHLVKSLADLPAARATVLDVTPRQLLDLAGERVSGHDRRALSRYRYGPGVCKVDWALSGPVPWSGARCRDTVTLHVGGTFEEIARSEDDVAHGRHAERPFCLVTQPCLVDPTRAPAGEPHAVGLLPRPQRVRRRHDRAHGGPDRAVRPGLPRPGRGPLHHDRGGHRGPQPELRRWGHQRGRGVTPPDGAAADGALESLPHRAQGCVPLLGRHTTRWRRARHVRAGCGTSGPARPAPARDARSVVARRSPS